MLDVIEEQLGDLSKSRMPDLEKLADADLQKLANSLHDFTESKYIRLSPSENPDIPSFAVHPGAKLTKLLGGVGWGAGQTIESLPSDLSGALCLALMMYPRLAVRDGLEYFLDFYRLKAPRRDEFRPTILNLLSFYALAKDAIRGDRLVIVARSIWEKTRTVHATLRNHRGDLWPSMVKALAESDFVRHHEVMKIFETNPLPTDQKEELLSDYSESKASPECLFAANAILMGNLDVVEQLLLFDIEYEYKPILESTYNQHVYDKMVEHRFATPGDVEGGQRYFQQEVVIPLLGRLNISDLLTAVDCD